MPRKSKYDTNVLKELLNQSSDYPNFLASAKNRIPSVTDEYAKYFYYRYKNQKVAPVMQNAVGTEGQTVAPVQVQNVTSNDVTIQTGETHTESSDLKESYKKLLEDETGQRIDDSSSISDGPSEDFGSSGSDTSGSGSSTGDTKEPSKFAVGKLLEQIIISANNSLLWPERQLDSTEIRNIETFSEEAEASFSGVDLNDPNAVWYNLVIAGFLLPVVSRVDLLPKKMQGLMDWFKTFTQQQTYKTPEYKPAYEGPAFVTTPPEPRKRTEEEISRDVAEDGGLTEEAIQAKFKSENVVAWLTNMTKTGYRVSPFYDPDKALDAVFYRDKHIVRNIGDGFV